MTVVGYYPFENSPFPRHHLETLIEHTEAYAFGRRYVPRGSMSVRYSTAGIRASAAFLLAVMEKSVHLGVRPAIQGRKLNDDVFARIEFAFRHASGNTDIPRPEAKRYAAVAIKMRYLCWTYNSSNAQGKVNRNG